MTDAVHTARATLERSRRLGIPAGLKLEIYVEFAKTASIKVFAGEVESVTTAEPRGLGVRAVDGGRVGYAYTSDLSDVGIDRVLLGAADNARASGEDPHATLPAPSSFYAEVPGLWRPGVAGISIDEKAALAIEAEAVALAQPDVELVEESEYTDSEERVAIVSTEGLESEGERSFSLTYLVAHAAGGGDRQSGLGFTLGREPADLRPELAGLEAADKARVLLGASPCATGRYTVVLTPEVGAALLGAVCGALSADAVQKGRSVFQGRLDSQVGSALVELWDDGLAADGLATSPFDGEGVASGRTLVIGDGVLRSYLYDTYTAGKAGEGARSTGNATRGSYRTPPGVGSTNVIMRSGTGGMEHLIERVGDGLLVENVSGLHSGVNAATGEISVGILGRLIEGGSLGTPVREVTLATDFLSLLGSISDLGGDPRWIPLYGSVCTPSLAVQNVAVSGT